MKIVNIYTDGACSGNQNEENIGGWGCILEYGEHIKELNGGEVNTTNNRMELSALIAGLAALKEKGLQVNVYSDSSYLINCFKNKWYENWQKNGWKTASKAPVENRELWEELLSLMQGQSVSFSLVKGHLTLSNETAMKAAHKKYCKHNGKISFEQFRYIAEKNHRADELATTFQRENQ